MDKKTREAMHEITARVTSDMATEGLNWVKPWVNVLQHNQPMSARKHQYRGINRINLSMIMAARGYTSPVFGTYNQWTKDLGYELEGAQGKGIRIIFWSLIPYEDKKTGEQKVFPKWGSWVVFNSQYVKGW